MSPTTIAVLGIVGTVCAPFIGYYLDRFPQSRNFRRHKDRRGDWQSTWQTNSTTQKAWATEQVHINVKWGRWRLQNSGNDCHYEWVGKATMVGDTYIAGTWQSKRKPSSRGAFILLLSDLEEQGDTFIGFFVGPNDKNLANYGAWVMTRKPENLEKAKVQLGEAGPTLKDIFN
jgi:hypothetical protein